MMAGALLVLLGEAALTASLPLFGWFALAGIAYAVYIPLSEEPGLARRFGDDYLAYKRNVPRWIPRLRPWRGDEVRSKEARPERSSPARTSSTRRPMR
jgi:protein-S-isoprenylcysteine O-methyltransferase Ste14